MEQLPLWITPALVLGMFVWIRVMIRDLKEGMNTRMVELSVRISDTNQRIDGLAAETNRRFENLTSEMHKRFDQVQRELGDNRERMAKLEGSLEGFLAGRRDRDAA